MSSYPNSGDPARQRAVGAASASPASLAGIGALGGLFGSLAGGALPIAGPLGVLLSMMVGVGGLLVALGLKPRPRR